MPDPIEWRGLEADSLFQVTATHIHVVGTRFSETEILILRQQLALNVQ